MEKKDNKNWKLVNNENIFVDAMTNELQFLASKIININKVNQVNKEAFDKTNIFITNLKRKIIHCDN